MCCGSAERRRFGTADHALAQVRPRQFFLLGGGLVRLTAKPRYLLLHHRGKEKSNTVTALSCSLFRIKLNASFSATHALKVSQNI